MEIQFTLNKKQVTAEVGADTVLLGVLRDLGCKSVKCGCETTNCGLCTVWIDGRSRLSCSVLAAGIDGHEVTTLEGVELLSLEGFLRLKAASSAASAPPDLL